MGYQIKQIERASSLAIQSDDWAAAARLLYTASQMTRDIKRGSDLFKRSQECFFLSQSGRWDDVITESDMLYIEQSINERKSFREKWS